MSNPQLIRVSGKWILAGEHAVLRGYRAVALPRMDLWLELRFVPALKGGIIISPDVAQAPLNLLFKSLGKLESWQKVLEEINGQLFIHGTIPFGAGLGSSASLCVALTRWLCCFKPMSEMEVWELATHLEDQFHGKSSGIDVAVICEGVPIGMRLRKAQGSTFPYPEIRKLGIQTLPRFTFHDTGIRSSTQKCCKKVSLISEQDLPRAQAVDLQMDLAAEEAETGLINYASGERELGIKMLITSIRSAQDCFYQWNLVPDSVQTLEGSILNQGALAVKLIGSGDGGMMVALWPDESFPIEELRSSCNSSK